MVSQQQMVSQPPLPLQGGKEGSPSHTPHSSCVFICKEDVNVITRSKSYDVPELSSLSKATHNPYVRAAQHYSIVEDLSYAPCAMSPLEVL